MGGSSPVPLSGKNRSPRRNIGFRAGEVDKSVVHSIVPSLFTDMGRGHSWSQEFGIDYGQSTFLMRSISAAREHDTYALRSAEPVVLDLTRRHCWYAKDGAVVVPQSTFGHFSHYLSLIYTVALVAYAFEPSYPTNIVPLSDLSIISIRVLEPLRSRSSYLYSSPSWNEVKPIPVHVITGRRIRAGGGLASMTTGGATKAFPMSPLEEEERRIL